MLLEVLRVFCCEVLCVTYGHTKVYQCGSLVGGNARLQPLPLLLQQSHNDARSVWIGAGCDEYIHANECFLKKIRR
jgi:hypothetical protein